MLHAYAYLYIRLPSHVSASVLVVCLSSSADMKFLTFPALLTEKSSLGRFPSRVTGNRNQRWGKLGLGEELLGGNQPQSTLRSNQSRRKNCYILDQKTAIMSTKQPSPN